MYCNNCGNTGHYYWQCNKPYLSYGIILFKIFKNIPKILMVQRKDSICYIEFIRGKYDLKKVGSGRLRSVLSCPSPR